MKNMKLINKLFLIVLLSVLFTACGGGGGGKSSGPSGDLGTVSVFVTDSLSQAKGIVTAINGSIITLDVKDADHFIPPSNTINIDISQAIFSKGNISMLSNGQWIEVKGSWNGSILSASIIEIEGAPVGDGDHGNVSYVEVKGSVQSVNGNLITLTIYSYEHFTPPSNIVQADVSTAYYKHGSYSNLTPGVFVEVKGSWNGSLIIASIVEFKD